jgi:hypothetical protein
MCVTSMIMDHYREKWTPLVPSVPWPTTGQIVYPQVTITSAPAISAEEIAEFRALLERAREYDKRNNEPECELDEKRAAIVTIAKALGVEISFL